MKQQIIHQAPFVWYDVTGAGNPIAAYQCVSLATPAQVVTANNAGISGGYGDIVVTCPITAGLPTDKVLGVTIESVRNGDTLPVALDGSVYVQANAAFGGSTSDTVIFPAAVSTRTSIQTPFTNNPIMKIKGDVTLGPLTYNLCLVADTALPAATNKVRPLGYPLDFATAQYDLVCVRLDTGIWIV